MLGEVRDAIITARVAALTAGFVTFFLVWPTDIERGPSITATTAADWDRKEKKNNAKSTPLHSRQPPKHRVRFVATEHTAR